jgi:predicted alpha/beta superfamily hydrolase
MKKITPLLLIIILCHYCGTSMGQELPSVRDSLYSEILKEKRMLEIILPKEYKQGSGKKYDVIYVLDGEWNMRVTSNAQQYLQKEGFMPATIIVAVANTVNSVNQRDRDFTPTKGPGQSATGQAATFLSFLKNELIPYIDKAYPSTGESTLYGHSHGGTFTMFAFLNEPELFQSYLATDPSFWWDNNYLSKLARQKMDSLKRIRRSLFLCGRGGKQSVGMGIVSMDSVLKEKAPAGLIWKNIDYPGETHNSIRYKAIYDGLKFFYTGYNSDNAVFHPMNGTVLKNKPLKIWYMGDTASVYYTIDGSEPTTQSAVMQQEIILGSPADLKIMLMSNRGHRKTLSGRFVPGKVLPAVARPKDSKQGGFNYSYYEGSWDKLPDFKQLRAVDSGFISKNFSLNSFPRKNNYALLIEGYLEITKDGYYIFGLQSDDGSRLYVGGQLLFNNDGVQENAKQLSYVLPLEKGFYSFRLEYFLKEGKDRELRVIYVTPGKEEPEPIPFEAQYSRQ